MVILADLVRHAETLDRLVRTDPHPQVRRRAQGLLIWTQCPSLAVAATLTRASGKSLGRWRARFLSEGRDLLARQGWVVAITTVERQLHRLGYVYRRPRHDLAHRQNADAVASADAVVSALRKKGS